MCIAAKGEVADWPSGAAESEPFLTGYKGSFSVNTKGLVTRPQWWVGGIEPAAAGWLAPHNDSNYLDSNYLVMASDLSEAGELYMNMVHHCTS